MPEMSLATRCSACGTIFRVLEEQLKASDGWVRCGRCNAVFDGLAGIVDLDAERPPGGAASEPGMPADDFSGRSGAEDRLARDDEPGFADTRDEPRLGSPPTAPGGPLDFDLDQPESATASRSEPVGDATAAPPPGKPATAGSAATPRWATPTPPPPRRPAAPDFVRRAEREAHWQSPAMRAALIGSSLILLLMLALQVIYHQRDAIAARSSLAADWLRSACVRWNCSIEAPRRIAAVTIETSSMTEMAGRPDAARLTLTMRNRHDAPLAMPAVELSLTDVEGRLLARKALLPGDFGIDAPVLAGNAERPLAVIVSAGDRRIAGYTVELFYP